MEPDRTSFDPPPQLRETDRDIRQSGLDPDFWYPLARSAEVAQGKPYGCEFAGEPIVLVRTEQNGLFALEDRCAHRQVPLRYGVVRGDLLQCGYHCWTYDHTGKCVAIPYRSPEMEACPRVRSYPVREACGLVFVFPGDPEKAATVPFPKFPRFEDSRYRTRYLDRRVNAHYSFMHENLMDMNHQFLHRRYMGSIRATCLGHEEGKDWSEVRYTFARVGGRQSAGERFMIKTGKSTGTGERDHALMIIRTDYPYQTLQFWPKHSTEPALDLWNCYIPLGPDQRVNHTYGLMMIKKPSVPGLMHLLWPAIAWFTDRIFAEDRWIVELEQSAFDKQGADLNCEIFPPIRALRRVLVANGTTLKSAAGQAASRQRE